MKSSGWPLILGAWLGVAGLEIAFHWVLGAGRFPTLLAIYLDRGNSGKAFKLYGTEQPTRQMVEENMDFFNDLERGHGIYLAIYENGRPSEILFAGYSYD